MPPYHSCRLQEFFCAEFLGCWRAQALSPCTYPSLNQALVAADRVFGSDVNKCGFKVIRGCGVIQGDGSDIDVIRKVAGAVEAAGYSAENVAYGMGGGLLQKVGGFPLRKLATRDLPGLLWVLHVGAP